MTGDFILIKSDLYKQYLLDDGISFLKEKHGYLKHLTLCGFELYAFNNNEESVNCTNGNIFLFGFLMYKGKYNLDAAKRLIEESNPDWVKAKGDYCIIQFINKKAKIIIDPLRKFHIFQANNQEVFTSSFLACGKLCLKLTINQIAFYEKISRGYNIAPDTIFIEITRLYGLDNFNSRFIDLIDNRFDFSTYLKYHDVNQAIDQQLQNINNYFEDLRSFIDKEEIDLGISSGLDSRLLVAALINNNINNIQLHTHAIESVSLHTYEQKIAKEIAETVSWPLKLGKCENFNNLYKYELDKAILDNFVYFDGRNSHNMGSFASNYTKSYKDMIMGSKKVSINGIGGEVFRNYYHTKHGDRKFKEFAENWLFYRFSRDFLGEKTFDKVWDTFTMKLNKRLGEDINKKINLRQIRRYYSEIDMPDGDSINSNAHGKFYYFLTPYIEPEIIIGAYGILPFLGHSIKFEGKMIERLNKKLSQIPTHYGQSAVNPGFFPKLKYLTLAYSPQYIFRYRLEINKMSALKRKVNEGFILHLQKESYSMEKVLIHFKSLFPNINYQILNVEYACLANFLMLANSLFYFRDKISN